MHFLKKAALCIPAFLASAVLAQLDPDSWYTIYTPDNMYWKSAKAKVTLISYLSPADVSTSSDMGVRFAFPNGIYNGTASTPFRCQANSAHWVAFDETLLSTSLSTMGTSNNTIWATTQVDASGALKVAFNASQEWIGLSSDGQSLQFGVQSPYYFNLAEVNPGNT